MAVEHSVYLIKPEGMGHILEIQRRFLAVGLTIEEAKLVEVGDELLLGLYYNLSPLFKTETRNHLFGTECQMGVVVGEGAIGKLRCCCGEATNPLACRIGTIRRDFCSENPARPLDGGSSVYYCNVIHSAKDREEAAGHLRLFQSQCGRR